MIGLGDRRAWHDKDCVLAKIGESNGRGTDIRGVKLVLKSTFVFRPIQSWRVQSHKFEWSVQTIRVDDWSLPFVRTERNVGKYLAMKPSETIPASGNVSPELNYIFECQYVRVTIKIRISQHVFTDFFPYKLPVQLCVPLMGEISSEGYDEERAVVSSRASQSAYNSSCRMTVAIAESERLIFHFLNHAQVRLCAFRSVSCIPKALWKYDP